MLRRMSVTSLYHHNPLTGRGSGGWIKIQRHVILTLENIAHLRSFDKTTESRILKCHTLVPRSSNIESRSHDVTSGLTSVPLASDTQCNLSSGFLFLSF